MGAGGSTAASCSSLDLGNGQVPDRYRYYRQQNRQQQYLHEQRLLKYKKQARGAKPGHHLKQQSSSQFDLTSCGLADNGDPYLRDDAEIQYGIIHSQAAAAAADVYTLTDSDMARPMPTPTVMVLPPLPGNKHPAMTPLGGGAKKSNAGVASRILHQRQQQQRRSSELKKFSDSLPSLNNIHQASPGHDNIIHINHKSHHLYNQHQAAPIDCHERTRAPVPSPNRQHLMKPSYHRPSAIQANHKQQLLQTQEKVTNMNLVIDEPYRVKQSQWRAQYMTDQHDGRRELPPQSVLIKRQHVVGSQQGNSKHRQPTQMKRATSLSSLHNLNQSHHHDNHYHPRDDCQHQHDNNVMKRSSANLRHPSDFSGRSPRPPSINSCSTDMNERQQYQHQLRAQRRSGYDAQVQPSCDVLHGQYQLPPQTPPKQHLQNGSAMLLRKNYKYKQAHNPGVNLSKNNRYKLKQQQQHQPQVQGCPVLPPMPRSQSLHELIQLRATENGQRMRTTGTLRGPFGNGGEQANKVNLVAELLENRRQQRQTQEEDSQQVSAIPQNSETLLSQSSSTDDGIHDVSLNGNTEPQTNSPQKQFSPINRSSISSQECDKPTASRQRIFKRQATTSAQIDRSSQRKSQTDSDSRQDGPSDRSDRHQLKKMQHNKSTLKRSASHSALHHNNRSCNISDSYDQDGDESDDLNELAKFLYEFKQRQAKNQAAQASQGDGKSTDADALARKSAAAPDSTARNQADTNFQQSPNSTTSSSGFASSTCTTHSISSASGRELKQAGQHGGDKYNSVSSASSREVDVGRQSSASGKILSPKKYPAPPRPGGDPGKSKNCPISSKIKSSSSLLSIVDECQPPPSYTHQGQPQETLLTPGSSNIGQQQSLLCDANYRSRAKGDGLKLEVDEFKIDRVAHNNNNNQNRQQQLEQLRKYTNMRQMSRSELALNHLTSSAVLDPVANRKQPREIMQVKHQKHNGGENSKKPYTNRLFNLIRRISDKSEAPNGGRESSCGDSIASASERRSSAGMLGRTASSKCSSDATVGGHYGELNGGGCRSIDGREEINQKSELMNSGYPNKSGGGHSEQQRSAASGQLQSGRPRDAVLCEAAAAAAASESLCDLNFDCDFELIKKCASSANESARTQASTATSHNGTSHNESSGRRQSCKNSDGENKRCKQGRGECPIIDPTGRENNWRLAPTSSLLGLTHFSRGGGDGAVNGAAPHAQQRPFVKHDNDNYNNDCSGGSSEKSAGGKTKFATKGCSSFDVRGSGTRPEDKLPSASQQPQQPQNKLKWSASSWFLGGTGSSGSGKKNKNKKDKRSGSCPSREQADIAEECKSTKPSKEKSYLARLLPNSGGTASSSSGSKSKQKVVCDDNDDMISEADQLLVELDQSLDLVSGSSRRRRSSTRPSGEDHSVPWWQQVSNKITEEEARMLHEAQLNAISGDESSAMSDSDEDDDDDAYDNDDADYASINRALINETFDVDLSKQDESNHSNLYGDQLTIEQPGSPSDSFTFSAPSSPTPSERSPRAAAAGNSTSHEIDDANIATNGLAKHPNLDTSAGERSAQDKQRSSGGNAPHLNGGGAHVPCSSKFTYNRSAKTTTPTESARAPAAVASANTNCSSDGRDVGAKLGVGDVANNKRSNPEKGGHCRPAAAVLASRVNSKCQDPKGERGTNQMAEAANGKKPPSDNKIVDPSSSENSHTFTKVIPQGGVTLATATTSKRHPGNDETVELVSQVVRGSREAQMKGVAHGSQMPSQLALRQTTAASLNDDRTRCMTNIVRRDNEFADVGLGCALRNDKAEKPSPVSSKHLNAVNPARNSGSNDVIGLVANGNKIKSGGGIKPAACLNCHHAVDSDHIRPSDSGAKRTPGSSECCASNRQRQAPTVFNDPLCPIHGQAICCACCAHSSGAGQGETGGNLKQQQRRQQQRHELSGQCQLDTNGVECCGYDTESDNSKPRVRKSSSGRSASEEVTARDTGGCQCARVVNGNSAAHKLACQRPACENGGGSGTSDNGLRSCNGSSAAVVARTKTGHHHHHKESVVCNHRQVTPEEVPAAGNNKLIIQRNSCLCDASDPPLANENLGAPGGKREDGKSSNFSHPTCSAAAAPVNGCGTPTPGSASNCDGNTSSSPKVTYYHYSHEMKNFAPTTAAAVAAAPPSGKLRVDLKDQCCGGAVGSDQCRFGKQQQQHSDKCFCITTTPGASGGNNDLARKSEIPSSSSSSSCETGCLYHARNSSVHDDVSSRHPANEDVKAAPSCCSHNKTKKPNGGSNSAGKNKASTDALKPMTGNDNERHTKSSSSKMTDGGQVVSSSQVAARNDECHCCHVTGATGAAQTNGQTVAAAACPARFHSHAKCESKQPAVRCNPICRSNSELVADMLPIAGSKKSGQNRRVSDVLFGRLRNSLLNQRASSPSSSNQKHLLASSQVSLANHYGDGGTQQLIQSMLTTSAMGVGSSPVVNDFDDNFILKRKTPNAGLKSRC